MCSRARGLELLDYTYTTTLHCATLPFFLFIIVIPYSAAGFYIFPYPYILFRFFKELN